jgi:hypothetical protein
MPVPTLRFQADKHGTDLNASLLGGLACDASSWLLSVIAPSCASQCAWLLCEASFQTPDLELGHFEFEALYVAEPMMSPCEHGCHREREEYVTCNTFTA